MDKRSLRKQIAPILKQLSQSCIKSQSTKITHTLLNSSFLSPPVRVASYMSMDNEASLDTLNISLLSRPEVNLYIPKCVNNTDTMELNNRRRRKILNWGRVSSIEELNLLPRVEPYGIREPLNGTRLLPLDVVLVPGVMFTKSGRRLGHGMGYYDEFFNNYKKNYGNLPIKIGICLEEQLIDNLPLDDHDVFVDYLIIGNGDLITCQKSIN